MRGTSMVTIKQRESDAQATTTSSRSLVGLVATKSHACYLLGGTGWDWVRIPLGLNFSGSAGGVSGHT